MIARLKITVLTFFAVLCVLVGAYQAGARRARRAAELERGREDALRAVAIAKEVHRVQAEIDRLPGDAAMEQLRLDWVRD